MPISETKLQKNTKSDGGVNAQPIPSAQSNFFIELKDKINYTQLVSNTFGPLNSTTYNCTSRIDFQGARKLYSICKGQVLIQPQYNNSNKVNLILKPLIQPISNLPIEFFIYRGLKKSDFISGNLIISKSDDSSEFIKQLWNTFDKFYNTIGGQKPDFLSEFIGFPSPNNPPINSNTSIYNLFNKKTTVTIDSNGLPQEDNNLFSYELPIIEMGIELGTCEDSFGIDVILFDGSYVNNTDLTNLFNVDIDFVRAENGKINLSNNYTNYENKILKEYSKKFIDITAFYGLHLATNGLIHNDILGSDVNFNLLETLLNGFQTKHRQYIYINSENNRSFNFYSNYDVIKDNITSDILIGNNTTELISSKYMTNSWPLLVFDNTKFVNLSLSSNQINNSVLYLQIGSLKTANDNNFIIDDNLNYKANPNIEEINNYTKSFELSFLSNVNNESTISSIALINYFGAKIDFEIDENKLINYSEDINSNYSFNIEKPIFNLVNSSSKLKSDNNSDLALIHDLRLKFVKINNVIGVVTVTKKEDYVKDESNEGVKRVTYETNINNSYITSKNAKSTSVEPEIVIERFVPEEHSYESFNFKYPFLVNTELIVIDDLEIVGANIIHTKGESFKFILGLSKVEDNIINDLIENLNIFNSQIILINCLEDNGFSLTKEGKKYWKYYLGIFGESSSGLLKIELTQMPIYVYSMDQKFYFTPEYTKKLKTDENYNEFILKII